MLMSIVAAASHTLQNLDEMHLEVHINAVRVNLELRHVCTAATSRQELHQWSDAEAAASTFFEQALGYKIRRGGKQSVDH